MCLHVCLCVCACVSVFVSLCVCFIWSNVYNLPHHRRSIIRASTRPKSQEKYSLNAKGTDNSKEAFRFSGELTKSPSITISSKNFRKSDIALSSSDDEEETRQTTPPRHLLAPSIQYSTSIFIGRDDIADTTEKTHILRAQPGEVSVWGGWGECVRCRVSV